mmetsp:Transcript_3142/g.5061  ORF Transcript_3142/g.5061 Transcript_3142/m.5061 type:complete len:132 (-) Transcript_3142:260-655(-)
MQVVAPSPPLSWSGLARSVFVSSCFLRAHLVSLLLSPTPCVLVGGCLRCTVWLVCRSFQSRIECSLQSRIESRRLVACTSMLHRPLRAAFGLVGVVGSRVRRRGQVKTGVEDAWHMHMRGCVADVDEAGCT